MDDIQYRIPDRVRVRRESFGLLFYDTRSTKLTFVRSGDGLDAPPFTGADRRLTVARPGDASPGLARLLEELLEKGLIVVDTAE